MPSDLARSRNRGALLGLAAGDAVGTTVEFAAPGSFIPVTDMTGGGPFDLPAGAWTDDTSMALCLAESLVETGGFDPVDQLQRYVGWFRHGHWSSTGRCFDIGTTTVASLRRFERTGEPCPGDADPHGGGNGSLMRLAPVPMAFAAHSDTEIADRAAQSARTTHGAPQAIDATRLFALLVARALRGTPKQELLGGELTVPGAALHPEIAEIAAGSFREKSPPVIIGSGYAVRALEAALWAVWTTADFRAAILAAVNLGDDADTTAAIAGQLAGALYTEDGIPAGWRDKLVMRAEIERLADRLYEGR